MIEIILATAALLASPVGVALAEEVFDTATRKRIKRFMDYRRTGEWPVTAPRWEVTQEAVVVKDRSEDRTFAQKWEDAFLWFCYTEQQRERLIVRYRRRYSMAEHATVVCHNTEDALKRIGYSNREMVQVYTNAVHSAQTIQAQAMEALSSDNEGCEMYGVYRRTNKRINELIMLEA